MNIQISKDINMDISGLNEKEINVFIRGGPHRLTRFQFCIPDSCRNIFRELDRPQRLVAARLHRPRKRWHNVLLQSEQRDVGR